MIISLRLTWRLTCGCWWYTWFVSRLPVVLCWSRVVVNAKLRLALLMAFTVFVQSRLPVVLSWDQFVGEAVTKMVWLMDLLTLPFPHLSSISLILMWVALLASQKCMQQCSKVYKQNNTECNILYCMTTQSFCDNDWGEGGSSQLHIPVSCQGRNPSHPLR